MGGGRPRRRSAAGCRRRAIARRRSASAQRGSARPLPAFRSAGSAGRDGGGSARSRRAGSARRAARSRARRAAQQSAAASSDVGQRDVAELVHEVEVLGAGILLAHQADDRSGRGRPSADRGARRRRRRRSGCSPGRRGPPRAARSAPIAPAPARRPARGQQRRRGRRRGDGSSTVRHCCGECARRERGKPHGARPDDGAHGAKDFGYLAPIP